MTEIVPFNLGLRAAAPVRDVCCRLEAAQVGEPWEHEELAKPAAVINEVPSGAELHPEQPHGRRSWMAGQLRTRRGAQRVTGCTVIIGREAEYLGRGERP